MRFYFGKRTKKGYRGVSFTHKEVDDALNDLPMVVWCAVSLIGAVIGAFFFASASEYLFGSGWQNLGLAIIGFFISFSVLMQIAFWVSNLFSKITEKTWWVLAIIGVGVLFII